MIEFVYIFTLCFYILLALGYYAENDFLLIIAGFGVAVSGIFLVTDGISGIDKFITQTVGITNIGLGSYIFLRVTVEQAVESLNQMR